MIKKLFSELIFCYLLPFLIWFKAKLVMFYMNTFGKFKDIKLKLRKLKTKTVKVKPVEADVVKDDYYYYFEPLKMNVSRVNGYAKRIYRRILLIQKLIMLKNIVLYSFSIILKNNDYAIYYGDITGRFKGFRFAFQITIIVMSLFGLATSLSLNHNPEKLKIIDLMKVINKLANPRMITLYSKNQIKILFMIGKFYQIMGCFIYISISLISFQFLLFYIVTRYSSLQMWIGIFWILIDMLWIVAATINACRSFSWLHLSLIHLILLVRQFKSSYEILPIITNLHLIKMLKKLDGICVIWKVYNRFWEKFFLVSLGFCSFTNFMFTHEAIFNSSDKDISYKILYIFFVSLSFYTISTMYSLTAYLCYNKRHLNKIIKSINPSLFTTNNRIKVCSNTII